MIGKSFTFLIILIAAGAFGLWMDSYAAGVCFCSTWIVFRFGS